VETLRKAWPGLEKCRDGASSGARPFAKDATPKGVNKDVAPFGAPSLGLYPGGEKFGRAPRHSEKRGAKDGEALLFGNGLFDN
jgi:hypothetical protein